MDAFDSAHLIVAMTMAGTALILVAGDWAGRSTRALVLCLLSIAGALMLGRVIAWNDAGGVATATLMVMLKVAAILAGVEWGRRIGQTAQARGRVAANVLFRVAQLLVVVYGGLSIGYVALFPEQALVDVPGVINVRAVEFAVFAPVLGSGMLCATIAIILLRFMRIDRAELARLRALLWAAPFLLAGLLVADPLIPATLTIGLLIFLAGAVRYLVIQSRRGSFLGQFLSPQVAREVRTAGLDRLLRRERRQLSVVACDLRGFTAFARSCDSERVAEVLERYYALVGEVAARHGGTIKDIAGDGVLILLGAPLSMKDHVQRAAQLGLELVTHARPALLAAAPEAQLGLGVGIASGETTVGAIRGAGRLEYVAIGNAVNLAARLCARAEDGEVLADRCVAGELSNDASFVVAERAPEPLKGFDQPVPVCALSFARAAA